MNFKILYIIIMFLIAFGNLISISSANLILAPNNFNLTSIYGQSKTFTLNLTNNGSISLYNISLENNNYIYFSPIAKLDPNQNAVVNAVINSTALSIQSQHYNIYSYYNAIVGNSNVTHNVTIQNFQSSPCSFSINAGDNVNFINNQLSDVMLCDSGFNLLTPLFHSNVSYSLPFLNPMSFSYTPAFSGCNLFPTSCVITVLNNSGLINDPSQNIPLSFSLIVSYTNTNMSYVLPQNNYTLNVGSTTQGLFTITNTGINIARNLQISSDWITAFSNNAFDLSPGETKAISYVVNPILTDTSQTNQSYIKYINVAGNFNTIQIPISIFINYGIVSTNASDLSLQLNQSVASFQAFICSNYPSSPLGLIFCNSSSIYNAGNNNSINTFNATMTEQQFKQWQLSQLETDQSTQIKNNQQTEIVNNLSTTVSNNTDAINGVKDNQVLVRNEVAALKKQNAVFWGVLLGALAILVVIFTILYVKKNKLGTLKT